MTYFKNNTCSLCRTILLNSKGKHGVSSIWYILRTRPCCLRHTPSLSFFSLSKSLSVFLSLSDHAVCLSVSTTICHFNCTLFSFSFVYLFRFVCMPLNIHLVPAIAPRMVNKIRGMCFPLG